MIASLHQQAACVLLAQAHTSLVTDNTLPAVEKGWSARLTLKSVARSRGWEHHDDRALHHFVSNITSETEDDDIRRQLASAFVKWHDFHGPWDEPDAVARGLDDVRRLIDKLDALP